MFFTRRWFKRDRADTTRGTNWTGPSRARISLIVKGREGWAVPSRAEPGLEVQISKGRAGPGREVRIFDWPGRAKNVFYVINWAGTS